MRRVWGGKCLRKVKFLWEVGMGDSVSYCGVGEKGVGGRVAVFV